MSTDSQVTTLFQYILENLAKNGRTLIIIVRNSIWLNELGLSYCLSRFFLILLRTNATAIKVRMSDTGMKNGRAYNPQIAGSKIGSPAPNTISRVTDNTEDSNDFPSDCRKIKEPLFTQARGKRQSWQRINHTANWV